MSGKVLLAKLGEVKNKLLGIKPISKRSTKERLEEADKTRSAPSTAVVSGPTPAAEQGPVGRTSDGAESSTDIDSEKLMLYDSAAITITGDCLRIVLASKKLRRKFFELALINCNVIIACRVSPAQKAGVVEFSGKYKKSDKQAMLGIGDG